MVNRYEGYLTALTTRPVFVFADGSAHWTQKADLQHFEGYCKKFGNSHIQYVPGGGVGGQSFLTQEGGGYGIRYPPKTTGTPMTSTTFGTT